MIMALCSSKLNGVVVERSGIDSRMGQEQSNRGSRVPILARRYYCFVILRPRINARVRQEEPEDVCAVSAGSSTNGPVAVCARVHQGVGQQQLDHVSVAVCRSCRKCTASFVVGIHTRVVQEKVGNVNETSRTSQVDGIVFVVRGINPWIVQERSDDLDMSILSSHPEGIVASKRRIHTRVLEEYFDQIMEASFRRLFDRDVRGYPVPTREGKRDRTSPLVDHASLYTCL